MASLPLGIDVSHHNNQPDWKHLQNNNVEFVFLKATEGISYTDSTFLERAKQLVNFPAIKVGAYHFIRGGNPEGQAEFFFKTLKNAPNWESIVASLDWETSIVSGTTSASRQEAESFVNQFIKLSGKKPLLYCSRSWPSEHGIDSSYKGILSECPLWLAPYTDKLPKPPSPWETVSLWQFSDKGNTTVGSGVDLDRFIGTTADLHRFWDKYCLKVIQQEEDLEKTTIIINGKESEGLFDTIGINYVNFSAIKDSLAAAGFTWNWNSATKTLVIYPPKKV